MQNKDTKALKADVPSRQEQLSTLSTQANKGSATFTMRPPRLSLSSHGTQFSFQEVAVIVDKIPCFLHLISEYTNGTFLEARQAEMDRVCSLILVRQLLTAVQVLHCTILLGSFHIMVIIGFSGYYGSFLEDVSGMSVHKVSPDDVPLRSTQVILCASP